MHIIQTIVEDILNPLIIISIGLFVSLGYVLTKVMPISIDEWVTLFYVCVAFSLLGLVSRLILNRYWLTIRGFFDIRIFLPLIPLAVFLPAIEAEFALDPMVQILNHGDIHLGYIHQLQLGTTPVESVFIAGYPANYYWLYHAIIATLSEISGYTPAAVASVVNIVALFSSLLWIGKTLVALELVKHRSLLVGLMAIFVLFSVNLPGVIHGGANLFSEPLDLPLLRTMNIDGADRRLYSAVPKFFAFSSAAIGFMLFSAALYAVAKLIRNNFEIYYLVLISAVGITSLAVQQIVVIYVVGALLSTAIIVMILSRFLHKQRQPIDYGELKAKLAKPASFVGFLIWGVMSVALSFPLLHYNSEITYNYESNSLFGFLNFGNMSMIIGALYVLIPFYVLHIVLVTKNRQLPQIFIVLTSTMAIIVTLYLSLLDDNQYKGVYFLGILMAISALFVLKSMQSKSNLGLRLAGYIGLAVLILLALSNVAYVNYYLYNQKEHEAWGAFTYERGGHLDYVYEGDKRSHAFQFIYNNLPPDAVIITPQNVLQFSPIMYERPSFVRPAQFEFVNNIDEHAIRAEYVNRFYEEDIDFEELQKVYNDIINLLPNRQLYAVVKEREISLDVMEQLGAVQVYENEGANVYLLNPHQE